MISIIIPVYNVEKYLTDCLESILAQTYTEIEIILINDGSTDNSQQICETYARNNKNIHVLYKKNEGVSTARNLGLRLAKGDYIGFVDADDWIEPDMYKSMLHCISETNSQMCICSKCIRDGNVFPISKIYRKSIDREESIEALLSYNFPSSLWAALYKKDILQNIYLNENIHHLEDFEFQFRVLNGVDNVAICQTAFYNYRNRIGSANNSGFNSKVVTCLNIIPIIEGYINNHKNINDKYIYVTKSRITLVVSAFMALACHKDEELEKIIVKNARDAWFKTIFSNVPFKKKILVILLAISYNLYALVYYNIKADTDMARGRK